MCFGLITKDIMIEIKSGRKFMEHRIIMSQIEVADILSFNNTKLIMSKKRVNCYEDFLFIRRCV